MTRYPKVSTALLVIDPYNDFLSEGGKLWPLIRDVAERLDLLPHLRQLLAAARAGGVQVVFVPHRRHRPGDFDGWRFMNPTHVGARDLMPFLEGSWGAQFHPDFEPQPGEVVAHEHWMHSGFANTDLDYHLRIRGIDHLVVVGLRGNACVEATARYGVELGYHVTLVKDATATIRPEEWSATMEVNAPSFAHAISTTEEVLQALVSSACDREEVSHAA